MSVRTVFDAGSFSLEVTHEATFHPDPKPADAVLLEEVVPSCTTRSGVFISTRAWRKAVYVQWSNPEWGTGFHLLYRADTSTLFVGAGSLCAAVDISTLHVVSEHSMLLVWQFLSRGDHVVALGETECYLYSGAGIKLAEVPVDPPYDIRETKDGMTFVTSCFGDQHLRFSNPL